MVQLLQRILVYGCFGVTMEVVFTGLHSLIFERDLRMPGRTYIWMIGLYGVGGWSLGLLRDLVQNRFLFILVAVVYIYLIEFSSGWILRRLIGRCPWDYGQARFGIAGLIRLDYLPFWVLATFTFDYLAGYIGWLLELAGRV